MLKIAITGNIASGKSSVEKLLKETGYKVFDTDEMAHDIVDSSEEIKDLFKDFDILTDNKIDRKKLSEIVFTDKNLLKQLENIVHPLVKEEILKIFDKDYEMVFISVPQLFEAGFETLFDRILFVASDENIRLERLMNRNNLSKEEALIRINAQISESYKIDKCTYVIKNNGTMKDLAENLGRINFSR